MQVIFLPPIILIKMVKWAVFFIVLILLLLFALWGYSATLTIKDAIIEELGTDAEGRKLIKVTGVGGQDDGQSVQGYELPTNIKDNKFPLTVIVAPNQKLFGYFGMDEKITFVYSRGNATVWQGTIGDASGDYIIDYPLLRKTTVVFTN